MLYKTYSYFFSHQEIREILERKGYIVKSLSKVIDMIPELKENKKTIFRQRRGDGLLLTHRKPAAFSTVWLGWKKDEENELLDAVLELDKKWRDKKIGSWSQTLCKNHLCPSLSIQKYLIDVILGKIIDKQVHIVINN